MALDADGAAAFVSKVESLGTRAVTPCAAGSMVWRIWGEGPPLVLLHGASGSWTHWIRNVLPLAARFRVLVPDMPGFGDSDAPLDPHTAPGLADLVASGLDVLLPPPPERAPAPPRGAARPPPGAARTGWPCLATCRDAPPAADSARHDPRRKPAGIP